MKRWMSLLLSVVLVCSLCLPAAAAPENTDARLRRVTEQVKKTLQLDTSAYTEFNGTVSEGLYYTLWNLNWSGEDIWLNVGALEDGTVVSLYRGGSEPENGSHALPTFPKIDADKARSAAEAFFAQVLDPKTESAQITGVWGAERLSSDSCYIGADILLNGLPSPLSCSVVVRGGDNLVISFDRDIPESMYRGGVPSPTPAIGREAAAETLRGTLALELIYTTGEDETAATLRYVPKDTDEVCVDAQSGELVCPGWQYSVRGGGKGDDNMAEEATPMTTELFDLTQVELDGVEKLAGVLSREELDKVLRADKAFKLDGFALSSAEYFLIGEDEDAEVLCTLYYTRSDEDRGTAERSFTLDARTGEVQNVGGWSGWDKERESVVSADEALKLAEAFLESHHAHADEFALYQTDDRTAEGAPFYGFEFMRKANGVFFPENYFCISIDRIDGAVCELYQCYTEDVDFEPVEGIVSEEAALNTWAANFDTVLSYRMVPYELDASVSADKLLLDNGCDFFHKLLLCYSLEFKEWSWGVNARTGEIVTFESTEEEEDTYDDIAGCWAETEIAALLRCGVGYAGGSFDPDRTLTQWDLVCLLASLRGWRYDPADTPEEERDDAYAAAYAMGALTREERNDDAVVTRGELVKILLNCAHLASVASLPGIFTCAYTDRAEIPAEQLGYAALAQGYGLVKSETYNASGAATRAMAAAMLYRLIECEI